MNKIFRLILLTVVILLWSCENSCEPPKFDGEISVDVIRIDKEIELLNSVEEAKELLNKYPLFKNKFLRADEYPSDTIIPSKLLGIANDQYIDTLSMGLDDYYGDLSELKKELEVLFSSVKFYDPDFVVPTIYTIVTGYGEDLYISDSIIVIGLDYFAGAEAKYKPDIPAYMTRRYRKEYISTSIAYLISSKYNKNNILDNTMLAEMMYYGKSIYYVNKVLPCVHDSIKLGYSLEDIEGINSHEKTIYAHFVENQLFYEKDRFKKQKYCGEAPKVYEIGDKCPGRIGRWLGWNIVKKYSEKSGKELMVLMQEDDAKKIFSEATYSP